MSIVEINACARGGAELEGATASSLATHVTETLTLPRVRTSSWDSSTYDDWSEEANFQNAPQMSLIVDDTQWPSLYSVHDEKLAKYVDFSKLQHPTSYRCSSYSTCSSTSTATNCCAVRARSLTPKRPRKIFLTRTKKPSSCRLPSRKRMACNAFSCYPSTPSTTATINIGTPLRSTPPAGPMPSFYTYKDQLESTRRRDEGNTWDFPYCQKIETPDSSLLSPMSGLKSASAQAYSSSVSSESTPTQYQHGCWKRRKRRAGASPRKFSFTDETDLPRWQMIDKSGVSVVPETAAFNIEAGYFIGTWQLPNTGTRITILSNGAIVSTDPELSLSAKFLGSRNVQLEFPDGRVEHATLSEDGMQIEFMDGVRWSQIPEGSYSGSEQLNLHREENRLDRARASNICSIRSNFGDNDEGEFVDIPVDVGFCVGIDIIQDELDVEPPVLFSGGEELSLHDWCE